MKGSPADKDICIMNRPMDLQKAGSKSSAKVRASIVKKNSIVEHHCVLFDEKIGMIS